MGYYFVILKAIPPGLTPKKVQVHGQHGTFAATRYVKMEGSEKAIMDRISKIPLLSSEEEHELAMRYFNSKGADKEAANKIVESNLRLVAKMAHQANRRSGINFGDLVQVGAEGLIDALGRFDPTKGNKFTTFAFHRLRHTFRHYVGKHWEQTNPEISGEATEDEEGETRTSLLEQMPSKLPLPGEEMEQRELEAQIATAMKKLNEREAYVIRARIYTEEPKTLDEVGAELGLTKMRIKQIQDDALRKLQSVMGKSFWKMMSWLQDLQKSFRLAQFHGGEAEKKTRRKEREESGIWSQRDLRMRRLARERRENEAPPKW